MTLDEAILHAEKVADRCEVTDGDCKCAAEHRQLAEWLRELKAYKNKYHTYYKPRRTKDGANKNNSQRGTNVPTQPTVPPMPIKALEAQEWIPCNHEHKAV